MSNIVPTENCLDFIRDENTRLMISTALCAVTQLELWDFIRNFKEESFMFSNHKNVYEIYNKIEELGYGGHSGSSFGLTMRQIQYIAKNGLDNFKEKWLQRENEQTG
jgi:hypothetical protein